MEEELHNDKEPVTENTESPEMERVSEGAEETVQPEEKQGEEKKEKSFLGKKKQNAEFNKLQQQNETLKKEMEEVKDRYTRLAAEYDNYRKRTAKEIDMRYEDAKADVWKNIIGIIDDFERALQAEILPECQNYKEGVNLIYKKLSDMMASSGIEEIKALHEPFNPELHNAVMHIDSEDAGENEVVEVFVKGYRLGDKVIRPSMVKVAN
ncbi:MAG: nucleotide exchange factor GrpE [Clostridia bacterium]